MSLKKSQAVYGTSVALTPDTCYCFAKTCRRDDGKYAGAAGEVIPTPAFNRIYNGEVGKIESVGHNRERVLVNWPSWPIGAWVDTELLVFVEPETMF